MITATETKTARVREHSPRASGPHLTGTRTRTIGPLTAVNVFTGRSLRHSLRDGEGLLMAIALPALLMLLFTTVFGGAIMGDGYLDYVVPGIILLTAGFGASSVAVSVATDVKQGAIDRFRTLPIPAAAVVLGHVGASVVRNLFATAIVFAIGFALGFRSPATPVAWLTAVALITLYILAITLVFAFIGLASGSPEAANGYGFIILFLPYLSSAFVPLHTLPEWLQPVATHQPVTPIIEAVRGLLTDGDVSTWGSALAWGLGIAALGAALIALRFPRGKRLDAGARAGAGGDAPTIPDARGEARSNARPDARGDSRAEADAAARARG